MKLSKILAMFALIFSMIAASEIVAAKTIATTKTLVVYFSRAGEMYSLGNIEEGNTAIIAKIIAEKTGADLFEIKPQNDNYPTHYKELTEFAQKEKDEGKRPAVAGDVENFDSYDTIFIGYPIWWGDAPMIVYSFIDAHDFSGKTVIPFCTHEGSGIGNTPTSIKSATKAKNMLNGFEIYGHTAQNEREEAEKEVSKWLKNIQMLEENH